MPKVHRAYHHSWWRRSQELTERDYQAMCNFAESDPLEGCEGPTVTVRFNALAEYFGCSVEHVEKELVLTEHYGYQRRMSAGTSWQPGRGDALRTFQQVIRRLDTGELQGDLIIDVPGYLEKRFGPEYISADNIAFVERVLESLVRQLEEAEVHLTSKDFRLIMSLLDERIR